MCYQYRFFYNKVKGIGFPVYNLETGEPDDHPICVIDVLLYRKMGDARCEAAFCWAPGLLKQKHFSAAAFDQIIASAKDPESQ